MTNARAVAVILLPPEYRPTDPYPPHAPDDPEWVFESYDDYWYWLPRKEIRVAIHDPLSGETDVRRIACPTMGLHSLAWRGAWNVSLASSAVWPMGAGVLFVGGSYGTEPETRIEFCRYSTESELVPPEAVVTFPTGYWRDTGYVAAGQQSVAICWPGSVYDGSSGLVYVFTPDPEDGGIPLATIEVPNFKSGYYGSPFTHMAAEMGEQLSVVATNIGY